METIMDRSIGSASWLDELYRREYRHLIRYAYLVCGGLPEAEDAVQDAFVALHRKGLGESDQARAYLHVVILNAGRGLARRRRRDSVVRARLAAGTPDVVPGSDAGLAHADLVAAVARLPRRQREVIALRYWGGLSEAEIAAALGVSPGTVKSAASRGLASLAEAQCSNVGGGERR